MTRIPDADGRAFACGACGEILPAYDLADGRCGDCASEQVVTGIRLRNGHTTTKTNIAAAHSFFAAMRARYGAFR